MKLIAWYLIIALAGCTTLQPIAANQSDIAQRIAGGELLKAGDYVAIETKDGETSEFRVISLSATSIDGKHQSVALDQVVSIQKRVASSKKTVLLIGLILIGGALTIALIRAFQAAAAANLLSAQ
jgi:hypothetical protein